MTLAIAIATVVIIGGALLAVGVEFLFKDKTPLPPEMIAALDSAGFRMVYDYGTTRSLDRPGQTDFFYEAEHEKKSGAWVHRVWTLLLLHHSPHLVNKIAALPVVAPMAGLNVQTWPAGGAPLSEPYQSGRRLPAGALQGREASAFREHFEGNKLFDRALNEDELKFAAQVLQGVTEAMERLPELQAKFALGLTDMPVQVELSWRDRSDAPKHLRSALELLTVVAARLLP